MRFLINETYGKKSDVELTIRDRKLIQLVIQDGRAPLSQLAKMLNVSKSAVTQKMQALRERKILLDTVTYLDVQIDAPLYLIEIATLLGTDTSEVNKKLNAIKEVSAILWYNGAFNLLIVAHSKSIQESVEKIQEIITIQKVRIRKAISNWFHPPYIFTDVKDIAVTFKRNIPVLEKNDAQILYALSHNPRGTILELARATGSAPATIKKRIVALQKNGAIISTSTYVDLWSCGCDLVSASFIVTGKENVDTLVRHLLSIPKTGNVWEFDHEWNINVVFWIKDQSEVSDIINQLKKSCRGILDVELMVLVRMVGK